MAYQRNLSIKMGCQSGVWYWELKGRRGSVEKGSSKKFLISALAALHAWSVAVGALVTS